MKMRDRYLILTNIARNYSIRRISPKRFPALTLQVKGWLPVPEVESTRRKKRHACIPYRNGRLGLHDIVGLVRERFEFGNHAPREELVAIYPEAVIGSWHNRPRTLLFRPFGCRLESRAQFSGAI